MTEDQLIEIMKMAVTIHTPMFEFGHTQKNVVDTFQEILNAIKRAIPKT